MTWRERRERLSRWLTFYFFFTVPGLVSMGAMGALLWMIPYLWPVLATIVVAALAVDAWERRGQ